MKKKKKKSLYDKIKEIYEKYKQPIKHKSK